MAASNAVVSGSYKWETAVAKNTRQALTGDPIVGVTQITKKMVTCVARQSFFRPRTRANFR